MEEENGNSEQSLMSSAAVLCRGCCSGHFEVQRPKTAFGCKNQGFDETYDSPREDWSDGAD